MQAFAVITASPLRMDLSCVLEHVVAELTTFLRKVCNAYQIFSLLTCNFFF